MSEILEVVAAVAVKDEDIKQAFLKYLKALTDKEKPQSDWREVWRQQTKEPRIHVDEDRIDSRSGMTNKRMPVWVLSTVEYSQSRQVVKVKAFFIGNPASRWMQNETFVFEYQEPFYTSAVDVRSYTEAILWGQSEWSVIMTEFEAMTELADELSKEGNNV